jgi:hypothetical protein
VVVKGLTAPKDILVDVLVVMEDKQVVLFQVQLNRLPILVFHILHILLVTVTPVDKVGNLLALDMREEVVVV